jgi:hypothetical protein
MPKFSVRYTFHGRSSTFIEAESLDAAKSKIDADIERDDFELDADELDDVDYNISEMHPVTRDGREIWTTNVRDGDIRGHQSSLESSPLFGGS